ncbi:Response regulator receiver domain protein (CheY-like) [Desulfatibacillum aliphaticivorans]|uniref:Response regulator receiver domain protein (CheY-like) n=1 Tax=Desulfatibacillum aliphaticivorans TaxID=218208 RepID=B8FLE3_DESAL|nr:response regulator [Desulfatibacillum aliphaticivorans]ACL05089.1 Response regulator receiver domain protein (CheY-like) [Desulfatibacillum aliphaticivorans]
MDNKVKILLVEDNPADVDLTRENLEASKILHELYTVHDGVAAMDFLKKRGQYSEAPKPHMVLLDLNLPKKDGREVLAEMKADQDLKRIPVIVLTSSSAEEDVVKSYDLQASAYITKPVNLEGFGKIVKGIKCFWFSIVQFSPD